MKPNSNIIHVPEISSIHSFNQVTHITRPSTYSYSPDQDFSLNNFQHVALIQNCDFHRVSHLLDVNVCVLKNNTQLPYNILTTPQTRGGLLTVKMPFCAFGIARHGAGKIQPQMYVRRCTYVWVSLVARAQDNGIKCVLLQLSGELSFIGVQPVAGEVSGHCSRNLPRPTSKLSRTWILRSSRERTLKS